MNVKLISLVAIAAGAFAGITADVAAGAPFEVEKTVADDLIAQGLAKPDDSTDQPTTKSRKVKVRLLMDGPLGRANDVVTVTAAEAKAAEASGNGDSDPAAVAYALTLEQNQPKA